MSRQDQLDALNQERSSVEAQGQQERESNESVITQPPYNVVSADTNTVSFPDGLQGSLTQLVDGTSYLVAGNGVEITSASNGPITITSVAVPSLVGSANEIQFNNGGILTGDSDFTYDDATRTLTVTNITGSLTRLEDGSSYVKAGVGVTVVSSSNGSITVNNLLSPTFWTVTSPTIGDERTRFGLETVSITDAARKTLLNANAAVLAIEPDGQGGAFIGGSFTQVQKIRRNGIAHIDSSGSVSNWNVAVNSSVFSLKLSGSTLFAGGFFTGAGNIMDPAGTINLTTREVQNAFELNWGGLVKSSVELEDGSLIIGGNFATVMGRQKTNLAKINPDGTLNEEWSAWAGSTVNTLALSGSTLFVGGNFTSLNGITRNYLGAVLTTGTGSLVSSWGATGANSNVNSLTLSGSTLFVGGQFFTLRGSSKIGLGAVLTTGAGSLVSWNPQINSAGSVSALALSGSTLFVGGTFTTLSGSSKIGLGAVLTTGTGSLVESWNPQANTGATVSALVVSGSTLFAGGNFTTLSGSTRSRIGAVLTTGTGSLVQSWNPGAGSNVRTLAISGSTLFTGGEFVSIGGLTRLYIAPINTNTAIVEDFEPGFSEPVGYVGTWGNKLLFGASNPTAGKSAFYHKLRNRIAAFDASYIRNPESKTINQDSVLPWYPAGGANSTVFAFELSGSSIYAGGDFTTLGGGQAHRIAKIDTSTATTDPNWSSAEGFDDDVLTLAQGENDLYVGGIFNAPVAPALRSAVFNTNPLGYQRQFNADASINASAFLDDGSLIVGGSFTSILGQTKTRLAKINPDGTLNTEWNAWANNNVNALVVSGSTLFVGGIFNTLSGSSKIGLGAVLTTGTGSLVESWNPQVTGGSVSALTVSGSTLFVGGTFTTLSGSAKSGLGAVLTTGTGSLVQSWNAQATGGFVNAFAVSGSTLFVGGSFTTLSGSTRSRIGAVLTTGTGSLVQSWAPPADSSVRGLALSGSTLFVGGNFTTLSGSSKIGLGAVLTTGTGSLVQSWNPQVNSGGAVYGLAVSGSTLFVGGFFNTLSGTFRNNLGAVLTTGTGSLVQSWNQGAGSTVQTLAITGSTLFIGGDFITINVRIDSTVNRLAKLNPTTGEKKTFNTAVNSSVSKVKLLDNRLYLAGEFNSVLNTPRNGLAVLSNLTNDTPTLFDLAGTGSITSMGNFDIFNNKLYIAHSSSVTRAGTFDTNNLTRYDSGMLRDFNANGTVGSSVLLDDGSVIVGGSFTSILQSSKRGLAKINPNGTLNTEWNPQVNGIVSALALSGSTLFVGGNFAILSGSFKSGLGAVLTTGTGSLVQSWNPQITPGGTSVFALAVSGSTLFVGGTFTTLSGSARSRIGAVLTTGTGSLVQSWDPQVNSFGVVYGFALSGSTLFVGGDFTTLSGSAKSGLGAVLTTGTGSLVQSWNPQVSSGTTVRALAVSGSTLFVGGTFTTLSGSAKNGLGAVLTTGTGSLVQSWNPQVSSGGAVYGLAVSGSTLFVGGSFTTLSGTIRNNLGTVLTTGTGSLIQSWNPIPNNLVNNLTISGSTLIVGGGFTNMTFALRRSFSSLDLADGTLTTFLNGISGSISTVSVGDYFGEQNVLIGGSNNTTLSDAPALSLATSRTSQLRYLVDGNIMKLIVNYAAASSTGAVAGVGNYLIDLPTGYMIDTRVIPVGSVASYTTNFPDTMTLGVATLQNDTVGGGGTWAVVPINVKQLVLVGKDPASVQTKTWGSNTLPVTASDFKMSFVATIPVIEER